MIYAARVGVRCTYPNLRFDRRIRSPSVWGAFCFDSPVPVRPCLERAPRRGVGRQDAARAGSRPDGAWLRCPMTGCELEVCPQGQGIALCACAIGDCSWLVCVQGKARCAGNGLSPWQAPQHSHGLTQANPKGDSRLSRPGVAPLVKAISLPCATRLVAKQPGVATAANGTGAECLGRLSFASFFGRAKKEARARHSPETSTT